MIFFLLSATSFGHFFRIQNQNPNSQNKIMGLLGFFEDVAHAIGTDKIVHAQTGGARLVTEEGKANLTAFAEDVAHHHGVDKIVHAVAGGKRVLNRDGSLAIKVNVIQFIEDIAHDTGFDRAVHKVTGGKRVMDRNGCMNKEFLETLEEACHDSGFDMIVHTATGGNRMVRRDGTFDGEGMIKVAASVAVLALDQSGTVATTRAFAVVQKRMIQEFIDFVAKLSPELGNAASKLQNLKQALDGMMATVTTLLTEVPPSPAFAQAFINLKDIPVQLKTVEDALAEGA